jgi:predicted RNA-binding Zn-ribbon protein involved in translation (DUF1610 family)
MAIFACTSCGWVRRSTRPLGEATCPVCGDPARCLTPNGQLAGRARTAAASARALPDPVALPFPARDFDRPGAPAA